MTTKYWTFQIQKKEVMILEHEMVSAEEAWCRLGISRATFYRSIKSIPHFPQPHQVGLKAVRYKTSDIEEYTENSKRKETAA